METQSHFKHRSTAEPEELGTQINLLKARLENMEAHIMSGHVERFNKLRDKQRAALGKLQELRHNSGDELEHATTADEIWEELKATLADIRTRLD